MRKENYKHILVFMTFLTATDPTSWATGGQLPILISYGEIGAIYTQFVCVVHSMQTVSKF